MKLAPVLVSFALLGLLAAKEKTPPVPDSEIVTLDKYKVRGNPLSSFALSMRVMYNAEQKKVKIVVTEVMENSDAETFGLEAGDEIVKVNGEPVEDMDPHVSKDTALGKAFLNRDPGDTVDLDVIVHRTKRVTLRAKPTRMAH